MYSKDFLDDVRATTNLEYQENLYKLNNYKIDCNLSINPTITLNIQRKLVKRGNRLVLMGLLLNPNLSPELFTPIWLIYLSHQEMTLPSIKYNHPETQKLLETALLLM